MITAAAGRQRSKALLLLLLVTVQYVAGHSTLVAKRHHLHSRRQVSRSSHSSSASSSDENAALWTLTTDEQIPSWQEPKVYTDQELLAVSGKKDRNKLSVLDLMALKIANQQILERSAKPDGLELLRKVYNELKSFESKMIKEDDAKKLDKNPRVLAPIEKQAMDITNALMLGASNAAANKGLQAVYKDLIDDYARGPVKADAEKLYKAMKGLGTDEAALFSIVGGRSTDEIVVLRNAFRTYCQSQGQSDCDMDKWIQSELSGGDAQKAADLLAGNLAKADEDYYWSTRAAKWWSEFLKDSDSAAKDMIKNGAWWERGIGHFNQAIFGAARNLNTAVKEAQSFWIERATAAKENQKGVQSKFFMTMYVMATIGGSFGSKALDPTLSVSEVEEGMMDIAMNLAAMGATKMIATAAKAAAGTRVGIQALKAVSESFAAIRRSSFAIKQMIGIGETAVKLEAKAARLQKIAMEARAAGKIAKADAAAKAAGAFTDAAKNLKNAEKARALADDAIKAAETIQTQLAAAADDATRAKLTADYAKAEKAVLEATADVRKQLDKTLNGISTAKSATRQVNTVIRNIEKLESKVKNFFGQDIHLWPQSEQAKRLQMLKDLRVERIRQQSTLLGSSEDLVKAKPMTPEELKAFDKLVKEGKMSTSHGGLQGPGPKGGQSQFWDENQKVWRNGPGSVGQSGPMKGKDISGTVVELSESGVTYDVKTGAWKGPAGVIETPTDFAKFKIDPEGVFRTKSGPAEAFKFDPASKTWSRQIGSGPFQPLAPNELPAWTKTLDWDAAKGVFKQKVPAANLCQINPSFCQGPNPAFCVKYPEMCPVKGLIGRPRDIMPQIEDLDEFIKILEKETGKKVSVEFGQSVAPEKLTPVQAEINAQKTMGIGDGMIQNPNGFKPAPTFVAKDGWIIDGHHRWSSYQWAAQQGGPKVMPVTVIDIEIDELIRICDKLRNLPGGVPKNAAGKSIIFFSGLLELDAFAHLKLSGEQGRAVLLDRMKQQWIVESMHQMRLAGVSIKGGLDTLHREWDAWADLVQ